MCGCLLCTPYWGPGLCPGMCLDWELNLRPFGLQAGSQFTEPHQPGINIPFLEVELTQEVQSPQEMS